MKMSISGMLDKVLRKPDADDLKTEKEGTNYRAKGETSKREVLGVSIYEVYMRIKRFHSRPPEDWKLVKESVVPKGRSG